jgi:hypothetical protein
VMRWAMTSPSGLAASGLATATVDPATRGTTWR